MLGTAQIQNGLPVGGGEHSLRVRFPGQQLDAPEGQHLGQGCHRPQGRESAPSGSRVRDASMADAAPSR